MKVMKAMVLIGGISEKSLNKRFFTEVEKLTGDSFEFTLFDISALPFYSQDIETTPPPSILELKKLATESDALLIVTPEYNRSIPGVLKNAIDWGSRAAGQNIWSGKPTAIMGVSSGPIGTFGAQQHLRTICSQLNMAVMNQPTLYFNGSTGMDENGLTESSAAFIRKFFAAFEKWVSAFRKDDQAARN